MSFCDHHVYGVTPLTVRDMAQLLCSPPQTLKKGQADEGEDDYVII